MGDEVSLSAWIDLFMELEHAFGNMRKRLEDASFQETSTPHVGERQAQILALPGLGSGGLTAREISSQIHYDEANTYASLNSLVERGLLEIVPDVSPRRWRLRVRNREDQVLVVSRLVGKGEWTTYGDIAEAVYGDQRAARAVASIARNNPGVSNPHRILRSDGTVSPDWQGYGGGPDACKRALLEDGVALVNGHAPSDKHVRAGTLKARLQTSEETSA